MQAILTNKMPNAILDQNDKSKEKLWVGTQAEYQAIGSKDSETTYIVTDEEAQNTKKVYSVNGQTGDVRLKPEDVNAVPIYDSSKVYQANDWCAWKGELWRNTSGAPVTGVEPGTDYNKWNVGFRNENLLDNWDFRNPVNQRGLTEYTAMYSGKYCIDRWKGATPWGSVSADVAIVNGGIKISASPMPSYPSSHGQLLEIIPNETINALIGKTVTVSCKVNSSISTDSGVYASLVVGESGQAYAASIPLNGVGIFTKSFTFYGDMRQIVITVMSGTSQAASVTLEKIKLELGPISTLANDSPPDYGAELIRCMTSKADPTDTYANKSIIAVEPNEGSHNSIFRGRFLGNAVTDVQWAAIRAGTFDDLYIGDYWTISGINYRIAAFDYYWNCGDTACTTHHVIVVPDGILYSHVMEDTNITDHGYYGSKMRTSGLDQAKTIANRDFGASHILTHREYLTNSCMSGGTNVGYPTAGAWYDSNIELMSEANVYTNMPYTTRSPINSYNYIHNINKTVFPLFLLAPKFIGANRNWYWLRDIAGSRWFCIADNYGYTSYNYALNVGGVRPIIPICG